MDRGHGIEVQLRLMKLGLRKIFWLLVRRSDDPCGLRGLLEGNGRVRSEKKRKEKGGKVQYLYIEKEIRG